MMKPRLTLKEEVIGIGPETEQSHRRWRIVGLVNTIDYHIDQYLNEETVRRFIDAGFYDVVIE